MADGNHVMATTEVVSPVLTAGSLCLSFSFHANGTNQYWVTLSVILKPAGSSEGILSEVELSRKNGDMGRGWNIIEVTIRQPPEQYRVSQLCCDLQGNMEILAYSSGLTTDFLQSH